MKSYTKMKQEDKQLLLVDLCARLPYKIKVKVSEVSYPVEFDVQMLAEIKNNNWYEYPIPYLRSMSSMTEEEKDEMFGICTLSDCSVNTDWETVGIEIMSSHPRYGDYYSTDYKVIDWLNKKMFDYRGLIDKGLAIEAPEGMYGMEEQQ